MNTRVLCIVMSVCKKNIVRHERVAVKLKQKESELCIKTAKNYHSTGSHHVQWFEREW